MKHLHSGPLKVNHGQHLDDPARNAVTAPFPAADHGTRFAQDRAAVATRAILQIVRSALIAWLHGEHADMAGARDAIEAQLRDEFAELARTTAAEIRPEDDERRRLLAGK